MQPQFKTRIDWEKAQLIMQPALIRVLDNIRKELDKSTWKGTFREAAEPIPSYILCLTKDTQTIEIDIWQLCYQVCFLNYVPVALHIFSNASTSKIEVDIDDRLIDETGDIDWQLVEAKAQQSVRQVFDSLPPES